MMLSTKLCSAQRNVTQAALKVWSTNYSADTHRQANAEQLHKIYTELSTTLPNFFSSHHNFHMYNKNVIFEDNIRGVKTQGINNYYKQLFWIRWSAHIKFSRVKMNILKVTEHAEDCTVRVRWRMDGVPGLLSFWTHIWNLSTFVDKKSVWFDGFSIFHVGNDGLIHKHVVQKVMPDEERVEAKNTTNIAVKLAILFGLTAQSSDAIDDEIDDLPALVSVFNTIIKILVNISSNG